jgi:hypothetical protein
LLTIRNIISGNIAGRVFLAVDYIGKAIPRSREEKKLDLPDLNDHGRRKNLRNV